VRAADLHYIDLPAQLPASRVHKLLRSIDSFKHMASNLS